MGRYIWRKYKDSGLRRVTDSTPTLADVVLEKVYNAPDSEVCRW